MARALPIYMVEAESSSHSRYSCPRYTLPAIILIGILVVFGTSLLCNVLRFDRPRNTQLQSSPTQSTHPDIQQSAACLYRNSLRVHTTRDGKCRSWKPADFQEFVTVSHDDIIFCSSRFLMTSNGFVFD